MCTVMTKINVYSYDEDKCVQLITTFLIDCVT
jgi:hypothetical protein